MHWLIRSSGHPCTLVHRSSFSQHFPLSWSHTFCLTTCVKVKIKPGNGSITRCPGFTQHSLGPSVLSVYFSHPVSWIIWFLDTRKQLTFASASRMGTSSMILWTSSTTTIRTRLMGNLLSTILSQSHLPHWLSTQRHTLASQLSLCWLNFIHQFCTLAFSSKCIMVLQSISTATSATPSSRC